MMKPGDNLFRRELSGNHASFIFDHPAAQFWVSAK
jgi:hypothetical protein